MSARLRLGWLLGLSLLLAPWAQAELVTAEGSAAIIGGDVNRARQEAQDDALRQAAQQLGVRIDSEQEVRRGVLTQDNLTVTTRAFARSIQVLKERVGRKKVTVKIQADIISRVACGKEREAFFRKKTAILGFSLQSPGQAIIGGLNNVERGLPGALASLLEDDSDLLVHEATQYRLFRDLANAPTAETDRRSLTQAIDMARQLDTQFVVSGVVRDLSIHNPEAFSNQPVQQVTNAVTSLFVNRKQRNFAFEVFIHDGFSGNIVFQNRYETVGLWPGGARSKIGFGSPKFWKSSYGKAVGKQLELAAYDINAKLQCQPFITRITRIDGKTLQFNAGANSGIRPGDEFSLYRTLRFNDAELQRTTRLVDVKAALAVTQVQPGFSIGHIAIDPGRINLQEDDVLIAW